MAKSWGAHYLGKYIGNGSHELTHNMFGKAVENGKSLTILLDGFIVGLKYMSQAQNLGYIIDKMVYV